jgi:hypothetical protein
VRNGLRCVLAGNDIGPQVDERLLRDAVVELQPKVHCLARLCPGRLRSGKPNISLGEDLTHECKRAEKSGNRNGGGAKCKSRSSDASSKDHLYRMKHKTGAGDRLDIVQLYRVQGFLV